MSQYAKAIVGAIVAGLGAYQTALLGDGKVNASEWAGIAVTAFVALGAVWATTNKPANG